MIDSLAVKHVAVLRQMLAACRDPECSRAMQASIAALEARPGCVVDDAMVERAARVVAYEAGEDFDHVGDFTRGILLDTQRKALTAAHAATPQPDPAPSVAVTLAAETKACAEEIDARMIQQLRNDGNEEAADYLCELNELRADHARIVAEKDRDIQQAIDNARNANALSSKLLARAEKAEQHAEALAGVLRELMEDAPRADELATRLVAPGPKAAHVSCSETHEIADFVHATIAALALLGPTTPEGAS